MYENYEKYRFDYSFEDEEGNVTNLRKEDISLDNNLTQLLDSFKTFAKACGYNYVDEIVAKSLDGNEWSSEDYGY